MLTPGPGHYPLLTLILRPLTVPTDQPFDADAAGYPANCWRNSEACRLFSCLINKFFLARVVLSTSPATAAPPRLSHRLPGAGSG